MELNGALSNPLSTDKDRLNRLGRAVCGLRRTQPTPTGAPLNRRGRSLQAAVVGVVEAANRPLRVADVYDALRAEGFRSNRASVRKALHDRSRGKAPRLRRVGYGLYGPAATTADLA